MANAKLTVTDYELLQHCYRIVTALFMHCCCIVVALLLHCYCDWIYERTTRYGFGIHLGFGIRDSVWIQERSIAPRSIRDWVLDYDSGFDADS